MTIALFRPFLSASRLWRLLLLVWWAHLWRTAVITVLLNLMLLSFIALVDRFGASRGIVRFLLAKFGYELTIPVLLCGAVLLVLGILVLSSRVAWQLLGGSPLVRAFVAELRRSVAMERVTERVAPGKTAGQAQPEKEGDPRLLVLFAEELAREDPQNSETADPADTLASSPLGPGTGNTRTSGTILWRAHLDDARAPVILFTAAIILALKADFLLTAGVLAVALAPTASLLALHSLTLPERGKPV